MFRKVVALLIVVIAVSATGFLFLMDFEDGEAELPQPKLKRRPQPKPKPKPDKSQVVITNPGTPVKPKPIPKQPVVAKPVSVQKRAVAGNDVLLEVVDIDDRPIVGAMVKARTSIRVFKPRYTDNKGQVLYRNFEEDESFRAQVFHPRYDGPRFVGPAPRNTHLKLRFPDEPSGEVEVEFASKFGDPLTKGTLKVEDSRGRAYEFPVSKLGMDKNGVCRIRLSPSRYALSGLVPGFARSDRLYVTVQQDSVANMRFVFQPRGRVSGQIIGDLSDAGNLIFEYVWETGKKKNPFTQNRRIEVLARPDGRFELKDLDPGRYKLRVSVKENPKKASGWETFELGAGEHYESRLELQEQPLSLTGAVVDYAGKRIPGVVVRCQTVQAKTDEKGEYKLYGLPNGFQIVNFQAEGYSRGSREIVITNRRPQRLMMRLNHYGVVTGRLVGAQGKPRSFTRVMLICQDPNRDGEIVTASTDEHGWYRFEKVKEGSYYLRFDDEDPFNKKGAPKLRVVAGRLSRVPDFRKD